MKKYLFMLLALPLLFSCGNNNQKSEAELIKDSMNAVNGGLRTEVSQRESMIDSFLTSFNEIQANLDQIKEKEKMIDTETKSGDTKNKQEKILADIQLIYNLLGQNKKKLAGMSTKLKKSNVENKELQQMVIRLNLDLEEKDMQINGLKDMLEKMNIQLAGLQTNFDEVLEASGAKTEKMNTVYYVSGTTKDLVKAGVLTKEGGFIGIGKSSKLKDDFNKDRFTKADASILKEIPLDTKEAKILSTHASGSYTLEGGKQGKKVERLIINNPDEFWAASKYLVIIVD